MKTSLKNLYFFFVFFVSFTTVFGQSNCLKAWYTLDGTPLDFSGNNYNGTLSGTSLTSGYQGMANTALYFNGISDKVDFPDDFDFQQRTISLYFKTETFPTAGGELYASDHASLAYGATVIYVENFNGSNKLTFKTGDNFYRYDKVYANVWFHIAVIVNTNYVKYYVDGSIVDSIPNNSIAHSIDGDNNARIGATRRNDRYFQGTIDEVKIFNCALNNYEIHDLFTSVRDIKKPLLSLLVYPNPTTNIITVEIKLQPNQKNNTVSIYNNIGQLILQQILEQNKSEIDLSSLTNGIYLVKLFDGENIVEKTIMKE